MDQPTAGGALEALEPLVGEWTLEAKPPDGPPTDTAFGTSRSEFPSRGAPIPGGLFPLADEA